MQQKQDNLIAFFQESDFNVESVEDFKKLIDSGVEIDKYDEKENCTPLHFCVSHQKHHCWVPILLKYGADRSKNLFEAAEENTVTASDIAWKNKHYEVVVQLILAGGPCPKNVEDETLNDQQRRDIEAMLSIVKLFHKQIEKNKLDAIRNIPGKHSCLGIDNRISIESTCKAQPSPQCSSSLQNSIAEKRKAPLPTQESSKQRKKIQASLIDCLKRSKLGEVSRELDQLLKLHVNDYDEKEKCTPLVYCVRKQPHRVPLLLKYGADPSLGSFKMEDGSATTASDIAWNNKDYDIVVQLILAGGPCPKNVDDNTLNDQEKRDTEMMLSMVRMFHIQIQINKQDRVIKLSEKHATVIDKKQIESNFETERTLIEPLREVQLSPESSSSLQKSKTEKRKAPSASQESSKQRKYNSLIELMKRLESGEESKEKLEHLTKYFEAVNDFDESEKCTPLLYFVRNEPKWVPLLLKYGADPSLTSTRMEDGSVSTASDVAWQKEDYGVVCQLILADGPYPEGFDKKKLNAQQRDSIVNRSKAIENFHEQIKQNNDKEVRAFVAQHSKEKYAYNLENKCALLTALELETSQIYEFLISEGFRVGINDAASVNAEIKKHFTSPNILVFDLVLKSRLGPNNNKEHFKKVVRYFETLYEIEDMKVIVQLVASSPDVTIIFDFNRKDVCGMDPVNSDQLAEGRTFGSPGKILIAAQRESECELLGTLAHEMTHFALYLTYNNICLPYGTGSEENERAFNAVIEKCKQLKGESEIIGNVYKNYGDNSIDIAKELIVRVPQLIALHRKNPEKLSNLKKIFKDLFDFYDNSVVPGFISEASLIEMKQKTQEWNKLFGQLERLRSAKMLCKSQAYQEAETNEEILQNENAEEASIETSFGQLESLLSTKGRCKNEIDNFKKSFYVFVKTKTPDMLMASLIATLRKSNKIFMGSENIFVEIQQLLNSKYMKDMQPIFASELNPCVFILDSSDFDIRKTRTVLNELITEAATQIVFVTSKSYKDFEENFTGWLSFEITFKWDDLTKKAKSELLDSQFTFQEKQILLKDIVSKDILSKEFDVLKDLPVEEILAFLKSEQNVLGVRDHVFIERSFEPIRNPQKQTFKENEIIKKLLSENCVILADLAGMGKTTSAVEFARTLIKENDFSDPMSGYWVVLIDLKQHTSVYLEDDQSLSLKVEPLRRFFSKKIMALKNEFEVKIFDAFFSNSKILFIMDGVDEISPLFKKMILNLIKAVKESGNRLLVTTRTHLVPELVTELKTPAIKLKPFDESDQIDFLVKFWGKEIFTDENKKQLTSTDEQLAQLEAKANTLLQKFHETLKHRDFVGIPLQLYMMAEVFVESEITDDQMNLFLLYKKFVTKKLNIWINDKGALARNDNTEIQTSEFNVSSMHLKLAIESIFGTEVAESLAFPLLDVMLYRELILRIGLIKSALKQNYFEFVHKTYAEFLIADYSFTKISAKSTTNLGFNFFVKIFLERDYENIRKFINEKLKTEAEDFKSGIMLAGFAEELNREKNQYVLSQLLSEKLMNLAVFVLHTDLYDKQAKMALVKFENKYFKNSLQVAMFSLESFSTLWDCIRSFADKNDQKQLLLSAGERTNILEQVVDSRNIAVLKFILDVLSEVMDKEEFKELMSQNTIDGKSFIVKAVQARNEVLLRIFLAAVVEALEEKDQKALLHRGIDGILMKFVTDAGGLFYILHTFEKVLNELYSPNELYSFLRSDDWLVGVLCAFACYSNTECFSTLWSFVENHFKDKDYCKLLLLTKFREKHNVLEASCWNRYTIMRHVFSIARDLMTADEFLTELTTANSEGFQAFHQAFLLGNHLEYVEAVKQTLGVSLSRKKIRQLLKITFPNGRNLMHHLSSVRTDYRAAWECILDLLKPVEVKDMLLMKESDEYHNAFAQALLYPNPFVIDLLEWFKDNSTIEEMEKVFTERTKKSLTLMHLASYFRGEKVIKTLIEFFSNCNFHKSAVKRIFLSQDKEKNNPLFCALCSTDSSIIQLLWNFYKEIFNNSELKALIMEHKPKIRQYRREKNTEAVVWLISQVNEKFGETIFS